MVDDAALPQPRERVGLVRVPEIDDGVHLLGDLYLLREFFLGQADQPYQHGTRGVNPNQTQTNSAARTVACKAESDAT